MRRLSIFLRAAIAAALATLAVGAASASAANHAIDVSGYSPIPVGQPTVIRLDGVVASPEEFWDTSWIEVVVISANVTSTCPADVGSAGSIAVETGGDILEIALRPYVDLAGNFSNSVGYTPSAAGPIVICGYLYNEVGYTWDASGIRVEVVAGPEGVSPGNGPSAGGGSPAGGKRPGPLNLARPWVTRNGSRLICHPGTWTNATGYYSYRWLLDGRLTGVTGPRPRTPGPRARGHRVSCRVTAYGPAGTRASIRSRPLLLH